VAFNIAYTYQLIDKYSGPLSKIIAATKHHTRFLEENQKAMRDANSTITRMANRTDRLGGSLKALQSNTALRGLTEQAKDLNEQIDKMGRAKLRVPGVGGQGAAAGGGRFSRFGAAASGLSGVGLGMAGSSILQQTASVENAMIDLGRATDLPAADLKAFEERFMSLSEKIGISTDKLAIMAYEASKAGIPTEELDRFVKITANSAVAFEVLEEEAGRALGSIKAKMGLSIGALQEMMDRINSVADATSADGANMINIVERLSGTFNLLKVPPAVAAGLAGVADQLETSPELAASGMQMMIRQMMKAPSLAEKMVKAPAATIREQMMKLAKLPQAKQMAAAMSMFGDEAGRFAVKMAGNIKLFDETMDKAAKAEAMGSMEREMQSKLKSLSMLWKNLKNGVMNVAVAIGESLAPDIKRFGDWLREITPRVREFVREHPGLTKLAVAGAAILAAFALAAPIVMALGAAFSFVGAAVGLISMPLLLIGGLIAGIIYKWKEWTESGHPLVTSINNIIDTVGRVGTKIGELFTQTEGGKQTIDFLSASFDFLGVMISKVVDLLDWFIQKFERSLDLAKEFSSGNMAEAMKQQTAEMLPWYMKPMMDMIPTGADGGESQVNGTITVKAEPGTKARVEQPRLPSGNNVRFAEAR
jgi:TP901 family phage tail tape measure protein